MAGFFGLFNYEKEGPGIAKNAPKKKGFVVFFETFFRNFWKFITINLIYSIISIPLFTNGIASSGVTNVTRNIARDKHSFGMSDFFETVKKNWKQALPAGIINTLIYIILAFDLYFFFGTSGITATIGTGICLCLTFIFTIMNYYIWTLMITFKFSLKQIYRNSFKFVFINFKMNLLCFFVLLVPLALNIGILVLFISYYPIVISFELLIAALTYPCFKFLLIQFCVFPSIKKYIIDPYYEAHPDEDLDKRHNLGLDPEYDEEETDTIASDELIDNDEDEEKNTVNQ